MNEHPESEDVISSESTSQDVVVLLKKMQQHMVFLEKKLDILVAAASQPAVSKEKHFSKSYRSERPAFRRPWGEGGGRSSEERRYSKPYRPEGQSSRRGPRSDGSFRSNGDNRFLRSGDSREFGQRQDTERNGKRYGKTKFDSSGPFDLPPRDRAHGFSREKKRPFRNKKGWR